MQINTHMQNIFNRSSVVYISQTIFLLARLPGEESTGELQLMGLSPTPPYPMATTKRIDACNAPIQCHVSLGVPLRLRLPPVQGHDQHPGGRRGENCDSRRTLPGWPGHGRGRRWLGRHCHSCRARQCLYDLKITWHTYEKLLAYISTNPRIFTNQVNLLHLLLVDNPRPVCDWNSKYSLVTGNISSKGC